MKNSVGFLRDGMKKQIKFVNKRNSEFEQYNCMENRHTTEIRDLLDKKRLSKTRLNPDSRVALTPSMKQSRQVKKAASATNFYHDKQKELEIQVIEKRYQDLYQEYGRLVEEVKKRTDLCRRQEDEILKYEKAQERDKKEIERLKYMVGMISKQENGVQTIHNSQGKMYFGEAGSGSVKMTNSIGMGYNFFGEDQQEYSQGLISGPKLTESKSYKDLPYYKDAISPINSKNRLTSENDESYKFSVMSNPMMGSKMVGQSRNMSSNQSRNSLSKRNSSGFREEGNANKREYGNSQQVVSEKELIKRFEQSTVSKGYSSNGFGGSGTKVSDKSKKSGNEGNSKISESFLIGNEGNKSRIDFKRKRREVDNEESKESNQMSNKESYQMSNKQGSELFGSVNVFESGKWREESNQRGKMTKMSNSRMKEGNRVSSPNVRANSPNMRYKFIPSVDL